MTTPNAAAAVSNADAPAAQTQGRTGPRVLIVRPSALGDVARTVPALVTLRKAMPDAHITWLVRDVFADVVRHHPMLDAVIAFPRQRFAATWRKPLRLLESLRWMRRELRGPGFDIAIDLQGLLRSGLFTRRTGAKMRLGFANAREHANWFYNRKHEIDERLHTVDRMLGLLEAEGYAPVRDMRLYVGDADQQWWAAQRFADEPYVCIAPTAKWRSKQWPAENYIDLARRLLGDGRAGRHIVLIASPDEHAALQPMVEALRDSHPQTTVSLPRTTVGQMMALIRGCRLFVGNDSGPLHIAVGFDRPLVSVFGPTDPRLVGPYQREDSIVAAPLPADVDRAFHYRREPDDQSLIATVSVDQVWAKVVEQLERGEGR